MELVGILRVLWRRRKLVAAGAALALLVVLLSSFRPSLAPPALHERASASGFAIARVLVDTRSPLVADAQAPGAGTIQARAFILAGLLERNGARADIARRIGEPDSEVGVIAPASVAPVIATPLADRATEATLPAQPYLVRLSLDPSLPILTLLATAPDAKRAAALADAATAKLASVARESSFGGSVVRIERLASPHIGTQPAARGLARAVGAGVATFALWCFAIVLGEGIARRRRDTLAIVREGMP